MTTIPEVFLVLAIMETLVVSLGDIDAMKLVRVFIDFFGHEDEPSS